MQSKTQESRVRRKAHRLGYRVTKSREWKYVPHLNNRGEYMLLSDRNSPILGWNYDASLHEIENFLNE
jgi:hypothetical protein